MSKKNIYTLITIIAIFVFCLYFIFGQNNEIVDSELVGKKSLVSKIREFTQENISSDETVKYINDKYNFSFEFEKGVNTTSFKEGEEGDIILVKKNDDKTEFQIFISEFDEEGPITPNRIKQDLPSLPINNPQNVIIGKDQITALIFESESENKSLGKTREIWFAKNGYLYQITGPLSKDLFIGPILETLKFN